MKNIVNKIFYVLKFILLIASFALSLLIIVKMYERLGKSLKESLSFFFPFLAIFIVFAINMVVDQKSVKDNIFFNVTCCLVLLVISYIGYRTIFDKNMIINNYMGYGMSFNYYSEAVPSIKMLLYGLVITDIFLMFVKEDKKIIKEESTSEILLEKELIKQEPKEENVGKEIKEVRRVPKKKNTYTPKPSSRKRNEQYSSKNKYDNDKKKR